MYTSAPWRKELLAELKTPPAYFQAYFWLLYNGSQLLVLPLLSRKLKMPSMTIASLSSVSRVAYFGLLAIANKPWLLYLAAGLNSLAGLQGILIRFLIQICVASCWVDLWALFGIQRVLQSYPTGLDWQQCFRPASLAPSSL